jgi:hypothetical protein
MRQYIIDRTLLAADAIIDEDLTLREVAPLLGISHTTLHADIHDRLSKINPSKYSQVKTVFERHKHNKKAHGGNDEWKKLL